MKRFIVIIAALLMLVSCGQLPEPDANELAQDIILNQSAGEFEPADNDMISLLFDVDTAGYSDCVLYYSAEPACADIIVIFKSEQSDLLADTKEILEDFREDRLEDFKGYAPEEAAKIESSKVLTKGKYVIWVVMPDEDDALKRIDTAFSK